MEQTKDFIKSEIFSPVFDLEKQYATYKGVLKNAEQGKVVTRFPPEPSGYLHIGHIKAALLNYHYAKMYKGKMILRFDDTNPSKQKEEYVDSIMEDLKDLGVNFDKLSYTSDYFDQILSLGKELIAKGRAYVDNTPMLQMRDERGKCIESKNRNLSIQENQKIFATMIEGKADDYVLRAKIDMKSPNGTLRDPVLFRTQKIEHHRTGKKYTLFPTYDFACPVVDSLEGVTHVLRTNEYADRIPQFLWVLKALDKPPLEIYEYSRLNLEFTVLSKRKLQWFVDTKKVSGWDDPRFPTYRGVLRKGIRKETLIEFMLEQGPSKNTNLMEWDKIWATNKRIIDPLCGRFSAVSVEKASVVEVLNGPEKPEAFSVVVSPTNAALGMRPYWRSKNVLLEFQDAEQIQVDEKVTLMSWGNFLIKSKQLQADGSYKLTALYLEDDKDFKKTRKYTWLAQDVDLPKAELTEYDHLITKRKIEEDDKIEDLVNNNSRLPCLCYVEPSIRTLQTGAFVQFLRRGYYKVDKIAPGPGGDLFYEFIYTPDGKVSKGIASIKTEAVKKGDIKKEGLEEKVKNKNEKLGRGPGAEGQGETKAEKKEKKKKEKAEGAQGAEEKTAEEGAEKQPPKEKKKKEKVEGAEDKPAGQGAEKQPKESKAEKKAKANKEGKEKKVEGEVQAEVKTDAKVEAKTEAPAQKAETSPPAETKAQQPKEDPPAEK